MNKNILIVDDNDVNTELILQLTKNYSLENDIELNIFTAANGQEAIEVCERESIDLIFMDLMMPVMDGVEATKVIKKSYPKIMIIVISTIGDEKRQQEMLVNGAEDYMTKPVIAAVFKSRLHNYLQLIQNRNHISGSPKALNMFTKKVYSYNMNFSISSEATLSEFWEAMLIRLDLQRQINNLSDFVRFVYDLGMIQIKQKFKFNLTVEEDVENFYFTIDNINLIGCERVNVLTNQYCSHAIYICKDNYLTFLLKKKDIETFESPTVTTNTDTDTVTYTNDSTNITEPTQTVHTTTPRYEELMTFDILDNDDVSDFEDFLIKLSSLILVMENSNMEEEEIDEISYCLTSIGSILSVSNDIYVISNAIQGLSTSISNNRECFKNNSKDLYTFLNAFVNDLFFWKTKIFHEGAPSVDFLNDSITSNANMFNALLMPDSIDYQDIDDIFDF